MAVTSFGRILWWGNVRALSVRDRAQFAARHGFDALNIAPADVVALLHAGETLDSIRAMAEDVGVSFTYLDPVVSWLPDWAPGQTAADFVPFLEAGLGRELEFAHGLGIDRMLTITCFPSGRYHMEEVAEHLSIFAQRMAPEGITCVLEAMPMWGLKTFAEVDALRRQAGQPNIRLLFDTWHYIRGGRDDSLLASIPPGMIDHVQIADGSLQCPPGISLFEDCLQRRCVPGAGEMPLTEVLSALKENGHLISVGPEVFSASLDAMTADEIAETLMPAFDAILPKDIRKGAA
ncbi:sugar phosphate isomerase/epimerase [Roseobacter sp. YSTF-M11]|uniref:Sugar phosphate isomerase/epimerase n=1 Tax=Roseobacter insulae TaxID=2859783 RepID=A0A9X1FRM7_9RHOB|nr:sugar phosphate isomerase/epimerase family protein [Roseobacter insulae]MBW4706327.1 sugar phosphate isomerase/epimerase [Roseobacter insulae]